MISRESNMERTLRSRALVAALFLVLVCVLLAGCATPVRWVGNGNLGNDQASCDFQAAAATQTTDASLRGGLAQEIDRSLRRIELTKLCMRSKGWRQG